MATVTLSVGALSKSWTLSAGDVTRVLEALKATYGPVRDESGAPVRDMTNAEVFEHLARGFIDGLKSAVKHVEGAAAAATAQAAIPDVDAA